LQTRADQIMGAELSQNAGQPTGGSGPRVRHAFLRLAKATLEALALPYFRPVAPSDQILLSCQALLLTPSKLIVDIEHATPFVRTNSLRFDEARTRGVIRTLLGRDNCLGVIAWSEACRRGFLKKIGHPGIADKTLIVRPTTDLVCEDATRRT